MELWLFPPDISITIVLIFMQDQENQPVDQGAMVLNKVGSPYLLRIGDKTDFLLFS